MRQLIDALPFAALVANNNGRYILANRAASELTGYSNLELRRLSVWDLTPVPMEHNAEVLWRAFLQQREQTGDYTLMIKDGHSVRALYAAHAHVLPGLHISLMRSDAD